MRRTSPTTQSISEFLSKFKEKYGAVMNRGCCKAAQGVGGNTVGGPGGGKTGEKWVVREPEAGGVEIEPKRGCSFNPRYTSKEKFGEYLSVYGRACLS